MSTFELGVQDGMEKTAVTPNLRLSMIGKADDMLKALPSKIREARKAHRAAGGKGIGEAAERLEREYARISKRRNAMMTGKSSRGQQKTIQEMDKAKPMGTSGKSRPKSQVAAGDATAASRPRAKAKDVGSKEVTQSASTKAMKGPPAPLPQAARKAEAGPKTKVVKAPPKEQPSGPTMSAQVQPGTAAAKPAPGAKLKQPKHDAAPVFQNVRYDQTQMVPPAQLTAQTQRVAPPAEPTMMLGGGRTQTWQQPAPQIPQPGQAGPSGVPIPAAPTPGASLKTQQVDMRNIVSAGPAGPMPGTPGPTGRPIPNAPVPPAGPDTGSIHPGPTPAANIGVAKGMQQAQNQTPQTLTRMLLPAAIGGGALGAGAAGASALMQPQQQQPYAPQPYY